MPRDFFPSQLDVNHEKLYTDRIGRRGNAEGHVFSAGLTLGN
jgi:hypothetical protein